MNSKKRFILLAVFLIIISLVAVMSGYLGLNLTPIESFISGNHLFSSLVYNALFIVLSSFSFSVSALISLGVSLFSMHEVVIYAMIAIMASSIIHFYISRKLGKEYVREYLEKKRGKIEKFDEIIERDAFKTVLILSAIFFVPPTIPNFFGGIAKISLKDYIAATFLGNLPPTFFAVYLISGLLSSSSSKIYFSIAGLAITTLIALYLYKGQTAELLKLSFPWAFRKKEKKE